MKKAEQFIRFQKLVNEIENKKMNSAERNPIDKQSLSGMAEKKIMKGKNNNGN